MTPTDQKPEATRRRPPASPEARARMSAAGKARTRTPEGKAQTARCAAANHSPEAKAKRNATIARNKARREAEAVPGQQEFFHVREDDGSVERWWIVPNTFGPTIYGPADDHPLGSSPLPGWYDADGKALSRNPRTVVLGGNPGESAQ